MIIGLADVWDFHTDLCNVQGDLGGRDFLLEQIDLEAARQMGGLFSATLRNVGLAKEEQVSLMKEDIEIIRGEEGLTPVFSASDLEGMGREVIHAEGLYMIEEASDLDLLDEFWEQGVRSLAPLYNEDNALGGGATGDPARGLTPLGRDLALRAWAKGFLFDCAHANHRTKEDLIDLALVTGNPLHYTHGHLDDPVGPEFKERGLPKESARRLVETGGLVGLSPHPGFLDRFERYLEEIDFLAEMAPDRVVLGSDFAGCVTPDAKGRRQFEEFRGVWGVPLLAERLTRAHGEDFARSFCGGTLKSYLKRALPA